VEPRALSAVNLNGYSLKDVGIFRTDKEVVPNFVLEAVKNKWVSSKLLQAF